MIVRQVTVREGRIELTENRQGALPAGCVRVRTRYSGVSAGTELAIIRRSLLEKGNAKPLGYQAVGQVIDVGEGVEGVAVGKWVACYGAPYVSHASILDVPARLTTVVESPRVSPSFSFCGLGTIALHAVRLGQVELGDVIAVVGLGVLGNLVAQLARLAGGRVAALDISAERCEVARACGVDATSSWDELEKIVQGQSSSQGADVVFLATNACGNDLLEQCVALLRLCGRLVIVGNVEAVFPREVLFEKEATLIVARAGGPGRYDPQYEAGPADYPYAYVRWTEGRNLAEFVRLTAEGRANVDPLVTQIAPVGKCVQAYEELAKAPSNHIGLVFDWGEMTDQ